MVKNLYLAIFFALFCIPKLAFGQQKIGIDWQVPVQSQKAESELNQYKKLGVSYLQVDRLLTDDTWQKIDEKGFSVYGLLPIRFPVKQTIAGLDSAMTDSLQTLWTQFSSQPSVKAIGIFSFGAESSEQFRQALSKLVRQLRSQTSKPLYYVTARDQISRVDSLLDFKVISVARADDIHSSQTENALVYRPEPGQWSLHSLKNLFERTARHPDQPLFLESTWLQDILKKHPDFAQTLTLETQTSEPVFPLPNRTQEPSSSSSIIAFMLVLLWIIFGITYNYSPIYRKSFVRYFTGHSFYVEDVMRRHIRELSIGVSIFIQHCIAGGIVVYCLFSSLFTPLGYQALAFHFPLFALFGTTQPSFFWKGFGFIFIVQSIIIVWLSLANFNKAAFAQVMNLYPWSQQLNLFIATPTAAFFLAGSSAFLIYISAVFFLLVINFGFVVTSLDMAAYINEKRHWFFAGTLGLYIILLIGLTSWILMEPGLQNVIELAVKLP